MSDGGDRPPDSPDGTGGPAPPESRASPNLLDVLRAFVRRASDGQVALCTALGLLGIVMLAIVGRWHWAAIAASSLLIGAGSWGVLDRARHGPVVVGYTIPESLMTAARVSAGVIALLSMLALALGAFGLCLGTWIS
ncbi:MAG TPA: hypothetical protein VIQ74_06420 [Gemmatimonadaceae bacterium]